MDPKFRSTSLPAIVSFGFDKIGPPSPLYVQRDDLLLIEAASAVVETVQFNIRMLNAPFPQGGQPDDLVEGKMHGTLPLTGVVEPSSQTINFITATPNNLINQTVPLAEGYLLAVSAVATNSRSRGIVFARAMLIRGSAGFVSQNAFQVLFADYPTNNAPVGWPNGRVLHPSEGPGAIVRASTGNPAAGNDFSFIPADALRWRIQSLKATLTTSATVANRIVHALVTDAGGAVYWNEPAITAQVASTTVQYCFGPGLTPQPTVDGVAVIGVPSNLIIAQRHQILSATTALQAGDQWSAINMGIEQLEDLI
jgi:hypothetical protein